MINIDYQTIRKKCGTWLRVSYILGKSVVQTPFTLHKTFQEQGRFAIPHSVVASQVFDKREMENKIIRFAMVACLVLGLLTGQSTALFKGCYLVCFAGCIQLPPKNPLACAVKCAKECFGLHSSLGIQTDPKHFCKLGCATSLCANTITTENPGKFSLSSNFYVCFNTQFLGAFYK